MAEKVRFELYLGGRANEILCAVGRKGERLMVIEKKTEKEVACWDAEVTQWSDNIT